MNNYEDLKQSISNVIKENGNNEITGSILNETLITIISTMGQFAAYSGIAKPNTTPGVPITDVFYIASENGIYSNFNGIMVDNELCIITNVSGTWEKIRLYNLPENYLIINSGKPYPFVNQPNPTTTGVVNINKVILNVKVLETVHLDNTFFSITLISRNATINNWGNAIHVRVLDSVTLQQKTSFSWSSNNANLDAETLIELSKISKGGLQTLSLYNSAYNRRFIITLNTDAINDGQIIDASYSSPETNKMYLSGAVYEKVVTNSLENYVTKPVFNQLQIDVIDLETIINNLTTLNINSGKPYPFINQPNLPIIATVNNIFLNVKVLEEQHDNNFLYTIMFVSKNNNTGGVWGNSIGIRRLNKDTLTQQSSYSLSTTNPNISASDLAQMNKMQNGGIQTISFYNQVWDKRFIITLNTDAINDGQFIDISYINQEVNKMYFSGAVYEKSKINFNEFATKTEINNLTTLNINSGKPYPFINQPNLPIIATVNNIFLNAKVYGGDYIRYNYTIVGIYKNHSVFKDGIIIARTPIDGGIRGYALLSNRVAEGNNTTESNKLQLNKISLTGIQVLQFKNVLGCDFDIEIDTDKTPIGYTAFGYQQETEDWRQHIITQSNYLERIKIDDSVGVIREFTTFKNALKAKQKGVVKVGNFLANSIVDDVIYPGDRELYKPSSVYKQYQLLNNVNVTPKRNSEFINIEGGLKIKSFGRHYIYFGDATQLYRTKDELKYSLVNSQNTSFEKILLDEFLPDSTRANSLMNCYELDNGELLIEARNGIKENENDDYRGCRTQLYLTNGLKTAHREYDNGVLVIDLRGKTQKVHEYKAWTQTFGKTGTTISIVDNKIAISPYYLNKTGLVHYSNDYGKTWKIIFNMGVEDEIFTVPYKGTPGAYPLPSSLNPIMPENMWTEGGNSNFHVHGCCIDPYTGRIYVCTGDAGQYYQGRTALWYTDDEGMTWKRIQTRGSGVLDSWAGLQPMGVVCMKNFILIGSDSGTDGLYRWAKNTKEIDVSSIEPAWWNNDVYDSALRVIYGGAAITDEGYIYSIFHTNSPTNNDKGVVTFTPDGLYFEDVYKDEINTGEGVLNLNWGSFIGRDRYNNIYISNADGLIIKLV